MKLASEPKLDSRQDVNLDVYVYIIEINGFNTIEAVLYWKPIINIVLFFKRYKIGFLPWRQCQIGISW